MTNYSVTIGYRAVFDVSVKADNKEEAEQKALKIFEDQKRKLGNSRKDLTLNDDRYAADGIVNMDETWNAIY